jgi:hypothetical protein
MGICIGILESCVIKGDGIALVGWYGEIGVGFGLRIDGFSYFILDIFL